MSPDELRQDIELQVVELLKRLLDDGIITQERAQQISQHVLNTLQPGQTLEELYKDIPKLNDAMTELAPVVLPLMQDYEQNVTKNAQHNVQELIRQGQYDAAVKLSKQVIDKEVKLEWSGGGKA